MDIKSPYMQELKDCEKASRFSAEMYSDSLTLIFNIMNGLKTYDNLGTPLTIDDAIKKPQSPKLQLKHKEIADILMDNFKKNKFVLDEKEDAITYSFVPVIQSGGNYNLDINSGSDDNFFNDDVIILCLGIKYNKYCSTIIRTIMITPTQNDDLKKNYQFLVQIQKFIMVKLRDGVELGDVYQATINYVNLKQPLLLKYLTENFGSVIGEEPKNEVYVIRENSKEIAKENMLFNVNVGLNNIYDPTLMTKSPHTYSLWIGDDVRVEKGKGASILYYTNYEYAILYQPRRMNLGIQI